MTESESCKANLPFLLPERPNARRIRKVDTRELKQAGGPRTMPMRGFEDSYTDIVDYIVRITEEIWAGRGIGRIYDTYDAGCVVYSALSTIRSVEDVVANTLTGIDQVADGESHHLNVAWSGDDEEGYYTSHLGFHLSTNSRDTMFGPASGRRVGRFFVADCITRDNRIHTEWLMRDNGAAVRAMGYDIHEVARRLADSPSGERSFVVPATRLEGQAPRKLYEGPTDTIEGWVTHHFQNIWNMRRLDHVFQHYAPHAIAHWCGGRVAHGRRNIQALLIHLLASVPDSVVRVDHVSWSDETDGVIVAVRWVLEGRSRSGGFLGSLPSGLPVSILGSTHLRFDGPYIVEEWSIFDEVGTLMNAYRGS
ncbi:ester cyclase [Sandaracinobacteroides saxicola]|nr:ester cyclase [Sandaracinobacteroides saxicola]